MANWVWRGNKTLSTDGLEQLYCTEKIHLGKNGSSTSYRIEAVYTGNRRETLLKGLTDPNQALTWERANFGDLTTGLIRADLPSEV